MQIPDGLTECIAAQRPAPVRWPSEDLLLRHYRESCKAEADWIKSAIPPGGTLLDIGCGLGGIDVCLADHFDLLYLMDGTGWDRRRAGFQSETDPWNDLELTQRMIDANALADKLTVHHINDADGFQHAQLDVIISCCSWMYHYPAERYLRAAQYCLKPTGYLCVDIRFSDGFEEQYRTLVTAGFAPTATCKIIEWRGRPKGLRQVFRRC